MFTQRHTPHLRDASHFDCVEGSVTGNASRFKLFRRGPAKRFDKEVVKYCLDLVEPALKFLQASKAVEDFQFPSRQRLAAVGFLEEGTAGRRCGVELCLAEAAELRHARIGHVNVDLLPEEKHKLVQIFERCHERCMGVLGLRARE